RIREPEIQRVKLHLEGMAGKTRACVLSTLANVLGTAQRWGELATVTAIDVPKWADPEMDFYDFGEWEAFVDGAHKAGPMVLCGMLLAGDAGLRRGELVALEQSDATRGAVTVCRNEWKGKVGTPKGGKSRRVPMTDRLRAAIEA